MAQDVHSQLLCGSHSRGEGWSILGAQEVPYPEKNHLPKSIMDVLLFYFKEQKTVWGWPKLLKPSSCHRPTQLLLTNTSHQATHLRRLRQLLTQRKLPQVLVKNRYVANSLRNTQTISWSFFKTFCKKSNRAISRPPSATNHIFWKAWTPSRFILITPKNCPIPNRQELTDTSHRVTHLQRLWQMGKKVTPLTRSSQK